PHSEHLADTVHGQLFDVESFERGCRCSELLDEEVDIGQTGPVLRRRSVHGEHPVGMKLRPGGVGLERRDETHGFGECPPALWGFGVDDLLNDGHDCSPRYSRSALSTRAERLTPSSIARCLTARTSSCGRYTLNCAFGFAAPALGSDSFACMLAI